ncbi:sulfur oxidation c-type cytochrome SoxA [Bradyrhizobium sp. WSM2793]|uniref:sulfur oxidation c-type cytochrome SoxA n=1 Tax=Bradyrhizobium sp. WSM2793 TaxID=1038866 RepID=UPI0012F9452C|nr:sulfur oxidation c-type cytochrome SoxA [Bradyrhizobium sp. WSM2793]
MMFTVRTLIFAGTVICALMGLAIIFTKGGSAAPAERLAPLAVDGPAAARPWVRYSGWPTRGTSKFNSLTAIVSPPRPEAPRKITAPLTGNPAAGQKLVADRTRGGSCIACHVMGPAGGTDLPGNVGPDLSEMGNAGRDDEWLFNYINDARVYNPDTVMPPWGTHGLLSNSEIGDIVAFLKTLTKSAPFKSALDDPSRRPIPTEQRDNLDAMINPAMWAVEERAPALWKAMGPTGAACTSCHATPDQAFKTWAAAMPKWEARLGKVLGIEEFVTRHAKATTGHQWLMQSEENTALSTYLRYLANGSSIAVDVESEPAKIAYERGKALSMRKIGALNFSCADCHSADKSAQKWIRGQWLGDLRGQLDHFPTWRTSQQSIWDIRKRFQWCQVAIWADDLPPDASEYGDLELYLAAQNAGQKMSVPGIRH